MNSEVRMSLSTIKKKRVMLLCGDMFRNSVERRLSELISDKCDSDNRKF
jgi:hypothetical protein